MMLDIWFCRGSTQNTAVYKSDTVRRFSALLLELLEAESAVEGRDGANSRIPNVITFERTGRRGRPRKRVNPAFLRDAMDLRRNIYLSKPISATPGFGDNIDNEDGFQEIMNYLELQYDDILTKQSRIKRNPRFRDNRVHALLYFIPPSGHALRETDIELMRRLSPRVNFIPVIGKADSLTPKELKAFKKHIIEDISRREIPTCIPFAVVGSEEEVEIDGEPVRARVYPWGLVDVDNPNHSNFVRLRGAILGSHLNDLKSLTEDVLTVPKNSRVL